MTIAFPANAGVIPDLEPVADAPLSLPRECGGDPNDKQLVGSITGPSPRMRG